MDDSSAAPDRTRWSADPLELPGWASGGWSEVRIERWTWFFVGFGIALRVLRYAMNEPLWGDEAFLAASFLDRGYLDLVTRPLEYHQVAPPLFLWAVRAAVGLFGFSESALRLFPMLCGVASVVVFERVTARILSGVPRVLAVATFAVAFTPLRHSGEVKPYASDLLAALLLLGPAFAWLRDPNQRRYLWVLALLAPVMLALSHPAVLVAGAIGLGLALPVARWGDRRALLAFASFLTATGMTFLALYFTVTRFQIANAGAMTRRYWDGGFPPRDGIAAVLGWLVNVHTSHMFAYPAGGANGSSTATSILVAVGALVLWRRQRRAALALLVLPFGMGLIAAGLDKYPYGGSARTMQYVAPSVCVLAALGGVRLLGLLKRPMRGAVIALLGLTAIGVGESVWQVAAPYKTIQDLRARQFARWFWPAMEAHGVAACVKEDLGVVLDPLDWQRQRTAVYLCNQRIYSPRHARQARLRWDEVGPARPLRCVFYNVGCDNEKLGVWKQDMSSRFDLKRILEYAPVPKAANLGPAAFEDRYLVYEFIPRAAGGGLAADPNTRVPR